jgi:hypothetical protein
MKNTEESWSEGFMIVGAIMLGLVLVGLVALYASWVAAFVGVKLWTWFIIPIFGLPSLSLSQAFGVSLLFRFWTYQHFTSKCKDERSEREKYGEYFGVLISPWIVLLLGWVCHSFFM